MHQYHSLTSAPRATAIFLYPNLYLETLSYGREK